MVERRGQYPATPGKKLKRLQDLISDLGRILIAFSGGADSTFLLAVACQVLGENVLAATARDKIFPSYELKEAGQLASALGVGHIYLDVDLLGNGGFVENPPHRCYLCKKVIFSELMALAEDRGLKYVLDGSNFDDLGEHRPGQRALMELGVKSPPARGQVG